MLNKLIATACCLLCVVTIASAQTITDTIPFGGNAWVTAPAAITDSGLINWRFAHTQPVLYFKTTGAETVALALIARADRGASRIKIKIDGKSFIKTISNRQFNTIPLGQVRLAKGGYHTVTLTGLSKTGHWYAEVSQLVVSGAKAKLTYVKNNSSLYFGRRGPSVHLGYKVPASLQNSVSWFYTEITVPQNMDKVGSYFMADGFGEGYFGMQVNSDTERRVLFSIWSPFQTDDPNTIPDSMRIRLNHKGSGVYTGEFGNEGAGGQSYMRYNWAAGKTYGFLLHAEPDSAAHTTTYTAWFKADASWYLVASFTRPQTLTHLKHLHSFLENFIPETGDETRMALYHNQWAADAAGNWTELTTARFTADATAHGGYRHDYAGGTKGTAFYLRNCGFFSDMIKYDIEFTRPAGGTPPQINFNTLPAK